PDYSDGTFNAAGGVDRSDGVTGNRITFTKAHGLSSGQLVTYRNNGQPTVGGLTNGRQYTVLVPAASAGIDPRFSLQLGSVFDGGQVDPLTDEIRFRGAHGLLEGDEVLYFPGAGVGVIGGLVAGKLYRVHVVDDLTIKLVDPLANTGTVTVNGGQVGTNVVNVANAFANNDPVTYRAQGGQTFNVQAVELRTTGTNSGDPLLSGDNQLQYANDNTIFLGTNPNEDGVFQSGHGLNTGDRVYYVATGGNGATISPGLVGSGAYYWVIRVDSFRIRLATTYCRAVGGVVDPDNCDPAGDDPPIAVAPITLTPDRSAAGTQVTHRIYRAADAPLPGLVDGRVYFVKNRTATSFQLGTSPTSGANVTFGNGGVTGGSHRFQIEGVNLTSAVQGVHTLVFDLKPGGSGTQLLDGVGGLGTTAGAPSGDTRPTASSSGSSGGVIDVRAATATATVTTTVSTTIGANALLQADTITVTATNRGLVGANTTSGGGGLVSIGDATASTSLTTNTTVTVMGGARLLSSGAITVSGTAALDSTVTARGGAGGLGAGVHSNANSTLRHTTRTVVAGTLTAGGDVVVAATTSIRGVAIASSDGSGLGVDTDATATAIVNPSSSTESEITGTARITANRIRVDAIVDGVTLLADADALAKAFGADSDAIARAKLAGTAQVLVHTRSGTGDQLVGNQAIWLRAEQRELSLLAKSRAGCRCFAGDTDATSETEVATTAKVSGRDGSFLKTADLTVDANQYVTRYTKDADAYGGAFVSHDEHYPGVYTPRRLVYWESTVIMLGEPNPILEVDAFGTITRLVNVVVTDDLGNAMGVDSTFGAGRQIVVGDIRYDQSSVARFRFNTGDFGGNSAPDGEIWGNAGLFDYQETWDYVRILNASDRDLVTHLIDVVNGAQNPLVTVAGDRIPGGVDNPADNVSLNENATSGTTFEFDIVHSFRPTLVEIRNLQTGTTAESDIIMEGRLAGTAADDPVGVTIENPIGTTIIDNDRGNIVVGSTPSRPFLLLRTNVLELTADSDLLAGRTGSIGTHVRSTSGVITSRRPIPVELVQFVDLFAQLRLATLRVDADSDAVVDLRVVRRETVTTGPLAVTVDIFHAGNDADVHLLDTAQELTPVEVAPVKVLLLTARSSQSPSPLFRTPPGNPREDDCVPATSVACGRSGSGFFDRHFRPDTGAAYTELGAFGGNRTTIDSDFTFASITGGRDISIQHVRNAGGGFDSIITIVADTDVDQDVDGDGKVDITTNGAITVVERIGGSGGSDLRVGDITSTGSDVHLLADERILDAESGTGVLGTDPTPTDVTAVNITMEAGLAGMAGGIGETTNFLEIDVDVTGTGGVLVALDTEGTSDQGIYLTETSGDLRIDLVDTDGDVAARTLAGSIIDAVADPTGLAGTILSAADATSYVDIRGRSIDLDATGGSIGQDGNDLEIDSARFEATVPSVKGTGPDDVALRATGSIWLTEIEGILHLVLAQAATGSISLTVRETNDLDEHLWIHDGGSYWFAENVLTTRLDGTIAALLSSVLLVVGDDVWTPALNADDTSNSFILAGTNVVIRGDQQDAEGTYHMGPAEVGNGTDMLLRGEITAGLIDDNPSTPAVDEDVFGIAQVFGNADVDTILLDQTWLGSYTEVFGSAFVELQAEDGEDFLVVHKLQTMDVGALHTLNLDGQAGSDTYTIFTTGSRGALRDYVVNVLDSGDPDDGVDELVIHGIDTADEGKDEFGNLRPTDDIFLLRKAGWIPGPEQYLGTDREAADRPAFVALLHGTLDETRASDPDGDSSIRPQEVQRINYDTSINGRVRVLGGQGNDYFAVDDNSAITSLEGGSGADTFQIGQIFGFDRDEAEGGLAPWDVFPDLVATTRGYLSPGISVALVAHGGTGDDTFKVYSNQAELRLEGDADNDVFVVRAFALALTETVATAFGDRERIRVDADGVAYPIVGGGGFSTAEETFIRTGGGQDEVAYNVNAPVSIDGGSGFDKVVILGTEFPDDIVVTADGIYGAGINVRYANVEVVEVDGLEGDDEIFVLSTPFGVATRVIGGLGSDTISVGGDVVEDIVTRELEGGSGVVDHAVESSDPDWDTEVAPGVEVNLAGQGDGLVIITESDGFTSVREGGSPAGYGPGSVDTYTVRLAKKPTATVYVTVSAARSAQQEADLQPCVDMAGQQVAGAQCGESILVAAGSGLITLDDFSHTISINGQVVLVRDRAVVLVFDPADWSTPDAVGPEFTISVFAFDDLLAEGERVVTVSHSVISADPEFDHVAVRNVEVVVRDNDLAEVIITEVEHDDPTVEDGTTRVLEGDATTGIVDTWIVELATAPTGGTVTVELAQSDEEVVLTSADPRFAWRVVGTAGAGAVTGPISFTGAGGAAYRIQAGAGVDFQAAGFAPGTWVRIVGGTNDGLIVRVVAVTASTLTLSSRAAVADAAAAVVTLVRVAPTIQFDATDWYLPVFVQVAASQDFVREDRRTTAVTHSIVAIAGDDGETPDAGYLAVGDSKRIGITVLDDDTPGVVVDLSGRDTVVVKREPGQVINDADRDDYTIRLTSAPTTPVTIEILTDGQTNVVAGPGVTLSPVGDYRATEGFRGTAVFAGATITRGAGSELGSFLAEGFVVGAWIQIVGGPNATTSLQARRILAVTASTITVAGAPFVPGAAAVSIMRADPTGFYTGTVLLLASVDSHPGDPASKSLLRIQGTWVDVGGAVVEVDWLSHGFVEGQLVRLTQGGVTGDFKILLVERPTADGTDSILRLVPVSGAGTAAFAAGAIQIQRIAMTVTFDITNWWVPVTVTLEADPYYDPPPGRDNIK
ncbi:MAG TPA: hypothetical protein VJ978_09355, partial [Nitriliruptoraceae bacterium]|nr:hypothetical protein [Nitriliruptoraceae bacterium]